MKQLFVILICFIMSAGVAFGANLPNCDDVNLHNIAKEKIKQQNLEEDNLSPINLRYVRLLIKNLGIWEEEKIENFDPKTDYIIADRMINLKINQKYTDSSFRLCKNGTLTNGRRMHLLMYEKEGKTVVEISNTTKNNLSELLAFEYE